MYLLKDFQENLHRLYLFKSMQSFVYNTLPSDSFRLIFTIFVPTHAQVVIVCFLLGVLYFDYIR